MRSFTLSMFADLLPPPASCNGSRGRRPVVQTQGAASTPQSTTQPGGTAPSGAIGNTAGSGSTGPQQSAKTIAPGSVPNLIFSKWDTKQNEDPKSFCGKDAQHPEPCRIHRVLVVGFDNLKDWMADSNNRLSDLVLVLNGRVMRGLTSRGPVTDFKQLQFDLNVLDGTGQDHVDNRDSWNVLIPEMRDSKLVHVAVATGGKPPYSGTVDVAFQVFPWWTVFVIALVLAALVGFIVLAKKSDIVRDAPSVAGVKRSYSLARCQMAWWFFIIVASYCYIWLTLNNHDSLTAGVLILTGISAATGLSATVIDDGKRDQRNKLVAEQAILNARVAALPAAIAAAPAGGVADLQTELADKNKRLSDIAIALAALPSATGASEGFLLDILRDESGISFHRFQMAGWTVILGIVFVAAVYSQLTMPDISPTLLGLMGISSVTYVGFKISDAPK